MAACHIHSSWSYDGKWPLKKLAAEFARRGYQVLMMSEHDKGFTESRHLQHREACAQASSNQILVLPGIEYSDASNTVHVLVWGQVPFVGENVPTSAVLDAVQAAKGIAVLAHPSRRDAWKYFDQAWSDRLLGIEIWNRKTDGWAPSQEAPPLLKAMDAIAFVGMDFHDQRQLFPLAMALDLKDHITEESILDCLRLRHCQARILGIQMDQNLPDKALPILRAAERGRRILASGYRHLRNH